MALPVTDCTMRATRCLRQVHRVRTTSFIGLGQMGREMAYNLFSKQIALEPQSRFVVCDAVPEAVDSFCANFRSQFTGANIIVAPTPGEAVLASRTIITMLPSSPHVRTAYGQPGAGIISALRTLPPDEARASLCIDSTTLDVHVAREIAAEVAQTGAQMVDAPVSGGVVGAKAATLSFLVGGTVPAYELTVPILAHMGQRVIHCGPSGAGLGAKICNNLVLGVQQIVVAEAMLLGETLGLDPAILAGVINNATGRCWSSETNNPVPGALPDKSPPCERQYEGGFASALMLKDMDLAVDIAKTQKSPVPLGHAAEKIYADMVEQSPELTRKDFSSIYVHLRKQVKETLA